ncbi:hypothetical protein CALVIDRAFT_602788 [Calocera viscosa TUFC12733]|uniref:CENP-V/GFA domain-containing protein n=1 Tax=Calocera viscosa (strain TUFC12733) TaxID=1330018 RepID=A0A167GJG6_CALVF|nr:hypothetical protein CALVIDRAFT_602788 [Calocera viscosa TUFC12733]
MSDDDSTTFHLACHCGTHRYPLSVPLSALPLFAWTCSCTTCRHVTGAPFITSASVPGLSDLFPAFTPPDFKGLPDTLIAYGSRPQGRRISCTKCGTPLTNVYWDDDGNAHWVAPLGALIVGDLTPEKVYNIGIHFWVGATGDGGMIRWIPHGGVNWATWPHMGIFDIPKEIGKPKPHQNALGDDVLSFSCKCKGVQFEILRPSAKPDGPGVKEMAPLPSKWHANHCFCNDCRLWLGHLLPSAVSVGREHIRWVDDATLKVYQSSPGMKRMFCGNCGAKVGTSCDENGWISLSVGLIDIDGEEEDGKENEGIAGLLKDWTEWGEEFSFGEEASDMRLRDEVRKGMAKDGFIKGA